MKSNICLWHALASLVAFSAAGCEVTSEKINLWKQSENGAPKIRAALRDTRQKVAVRVEAAEALGELSLFAPLAEDLRAIAESDRRQVAEELVKRLLARMKGSNPKSSTKVQVQAKDTLFALRDIADEGLRKTIDEEVLQWMAGDWENRTTGENSAEKMITAIGRRAGPILAEHLGENPNLVVVFSSHLRAVGDQGARDVGAEKLIDLAKRQTDTKILLKIFEAMGKVGSVKSVGYLIEVAQKGEFHQRQWALRALTLFPHPSAIAIAKSIAADTSLKDEQAELRDDAFGLLEKIKDPKSLDALLSFLSGKEEKVRYQAIEALLSGFGAEGLTKLLEALPIGYTYKKEDIKDFIEDDIIKLGKNALQPVRSALESKSWIARLIAIRVLSRMGTKEDVAVLEKLTSDQTKLRGWDAGATIGREASAAVDVLKSRK
jgi:HEAT repeat protein